MPVRGIRGATVARENIAVSILEATRELLEAIAQANASFQVEELASVFFTMTGDLDTVFPARAAREMGWTNVPLMCAQEIPVAGGLPRCIRVLIHWNTGLPQSEIRHIYLHEAAVLRPDLKPAD